MMETLKIEFWPIESSIPYARNARHNDDVVDQMVGSIQEYGFKIPVLALGTGEVVDGHLRLKAARKLGIEMVPVIRCMVMRWQSLSGGEAVFDGTGETFQQIKSSREVPDVRRSQGPAKD